MVSGVEPLWFNNQCVIPSSFDKLRMTRAQGDMYHFKLDIEIAGKFYLPAISCD